MSICSGTHVVSCNRQAQRAVACWKGEKDAAFRGWLHGALSPPWTPRMESHKHSFSPQHSSLASFFSMAFTTLYKLRRLYMCKHTHIYFKIYLSILSTRMKMSWDHCLFHWCFYSLSLEQCVPNVTGGQQLFVEWVSIFPYVSVSQHGRKKETE